MKLKVLLPFRVFTEKANVTRIVADTSAGSIGLLPNRLDCVAALSPGILVIETEDELVLEMKEEINVKREKLLHDAHQSAEAISTKRIASMQRAQKTLADEIARQTQDQVFAIARKTLRDLADTNLEERITQAFTRQLRDLNDNTKQDLADALTKSSEPVRVRSAFELTEEQQNAIRHGIKELTAGETPVHFEIAPNAIAGIELTSSGRKIAWSIDEYLTSMQKSISELTNPEAKAPEVNTELESEPVS